MSVTTNGSTSTVSGTISSGNQFEFTLNAGGSCGNVHILTNTATSWTDNGLTVTAGTAATVVGSGSCATSFTASSVTLGSSSGSGSGSPALTGTINSAGASTINVEGSGSCGAVNVTYTSSTTINYNGDSLTKGTPISVWGSGSCGTSFAATTITLGSSSGSSGSPLASGTINSATSSSINMHASGSCGNVNVAYSSSTVITTNGYSMTAGTPIEVWGTGSCATSITATAITLGSGSSSSSGGTISMTHVLTADYLGGCCGTTSVSATQAATALSWAEVSPTEGNADHDAGIKTLEYLAPTRQASTDPLYNSNSATFSYDCSGDKITISYAGETQYLMNPASSAYETILNNWAVGQEAIGHIDAFYFDDTDDLGGVTAPCNVSQSTWDAENATEIADFKYPVVFSGYSISTDSENLISGTNVLGGTIEECYGRVSQPTPPYTTGSFWTLDENLQLKAAAAGRLFFCYNNGAEAGSSSIQLRNYIYASFLLTYSQTSSVLWETFTTPSELHVFPETKVVPTEPLVAAPSSVSSLQISGGVYVREYGACYLAGSSVGRCAVVVNPSSTTSYSLPSLSTTYDHTMSISGNGSLDGGSVSASGAKASSTVAPETGEVLFQ